MTGFVGYGVVGFVMPVAAFAVSTVDHHHALNDGDDTERSTAVRAGHEPHRPERHCRVGFMAKGLSSTCESQSRVSVVWARLRPERSPDVHTTSSTSLPSSALPAPPRSSRTTESVSWSSALASTPSASASASVSQLAGCDTLHLLHERRAHGHTHETPRSRRCEQDLRSQH